MPHWEWTKRGAGCRVQGAGCRVHVVATAGFAVSCAVCSVRSAE